MDNSLRRLLDLVRRTGDRLVVTDPSGEGAYVIMGVDQYESLLARGAQAPASAAPPAAPVRQMAAPAPAPAPVRRQSPAPVPYSFPPVAPAPRLAQDRRRVIPPPPRPVYPITPEPEDEALPDLFDLMAPAGSTGETWDLEAMSDTERAAVEREFQEFEQNRRERRTPPVSEQNLPFAPVDEDDLGEEQFYLEPVE